MFKKFTHIFGLLSLLLVASVATGLSIWHFGGNTKQEETIETGQSEEDSHVYPDNILENYEFGNKKNLNQKYTYIFFPSTLYNEFYNDSQSDSDIKATPEKIFGYNEVVLDDFGNPVTDENGVRYNIVDGSGLDGYSNYYDYLKEYLNGQSYSYLKNVADGSGSLFTSDYPAHGGVLFDYWETSGYYYYNRLVINDQYAFNHRNFYQFLMTYDQAAQNKNTNYWSRDHNSGHGYYHHYNYKLNQYSYGVNRNNEILSPYYLPNDAEYPSSSFNGTTIQYNFGLDLTYDYMNRRSEVGVYISRLQTNGALSTEDNENEEWARKRNFDEQLQERRQYRNDRFGFWVDFYDWSETTNNPNQGLRDQYNPYSGSRYLPISITVNGNLTPDVMAQILPEVSASMFDDYNYADFTTGAWIYNSGNNKDANMNAVNYFNSKDTSNIFDIMQNPAQYADEDGVIRLYPLFNNSKGMSTKNLGNDRDALKVTFDYKDETSTEAKIITHKKMTYSSEWANVSEYGLDVRYAVLTNVDLKKEFYDQISIIGQISYGGTSPWQGSHPWNTQFSISGSQIDSFIESFGEGLYTFYLVIGNSAKSVGQGNVRSLAGIENYLTGNSYRNSFPNLFQKNLLTRDELTGTNDPYYRDFNITPKDAQQAQSEPRRPIALFAEKVTNLRLVSDIPIIENENGTPSANQDWNAIDQNVQQGLLDAHNFIIADDVTTYDKDNDGNVVGQGEKVTNPYVYFIQNADFRYVNNLYFQIRFSNQYIADSLRVVTDFEDYSEDPILVQGVKEGTINTGAPHQFVDFQVTKDTRLELESQNSIGEFFIQNIENVKGSDGKTRSGFKLKDYYARGIYDIILVSNGSVTLDNDKTQRVYNMYINRHTNSFIKLFDDDPGTFEYNDGNVKGTFVSHKQKGESLVNGEPTDGSAYASASTNLIWNGQTYLGETLTTASVGTTGSFIDALNSYGLDPSKTYKIVDAVTHDPVAYYKNGVVYNAHGNTSGNNTLDLFMVLKNYVLYIEELKTTSA